MALRALRGGDRVVAWRRPRPPARLDLLHHGVGRARVAGPLPSRAPPTSLTTTAAPFRGEEQRMRPSDAVAGARDDRDLVVEETHARPTVADIAVDGGKPSVVDAAAEAW